MDELKLIVSALVLLLEIEGKATSDPNVQADCLAKKNQLRRLIAKQPEPELPNAVVEIEGKKEA